MHERVIELIVYLMEELRSHDQLGSINVTSLEQKGYTNAEISAAFAWLLDKVDTRNGYRKIPHADGSVRFLHAAELSVVQPDGYGYLLQCCQLGLLSQDDVELVIERLMMSGVSEVDLDDVKRVIASVLYESDHPSDGGYPVLGPTDSIH